jgi:hypothetical protein
MSCYSLLTEYPNSSTRSKTQWRLLFKPVLSGKDVPSVVVSVIQSPIARNSKTRSGDRLLAIQGTMVAVATEQANHCASSLPVVQIGIPRRSYCSSEIYIKTSTPRRGGLEELVSPPIHLSSPRSEIKQTIVPKSLASWPAACLDREVAG